MTCFFVRETDPIALHLTCAGLDSAGPGYTCLVPPLLPRLTASISLERSLISELVQSMASKASEAAALQLAHEELLSERDLLSKVSAYTLNPLPLTLNPKP